MAVTVLRPPTQKNDLWELPLSGRVTADAPTRDVGWMFHVDLKVKLPLASNSFPDREPHQEVVVKVDTYQIGPVTGNTYYLHSLYQAATVASNVVPTLRLSQHEAEGLLRILPRQPVLNSRIEGALRDGDFLRTAPQRFWHP